MLLNAWVVEVDPKKFPLPAMWLMETGELLPEEKPWEVLNKKLDLCPSDEIKLIRFCFIYFPLPNIQVFKSSYGPMIIS